MNPCSPKASPPMGNAQLWSFYPCLGTQKQAEQRTQLTTEACSSSPVSLQKVLLLSAALPPLAACAFRFLFSHKHLQVPTPTKGLPPDAPAWRDTLPFAVPHSRSGNDHKPSARVLFLQQAIGRERAWDPRLHKAPSGCQLLTRLPICLKDLATLLQGAKIQIS